MQQINIRNQQSMNAIKKEKKKERVYNINNNNNKCFKKKKPCGIILFCQKKGK
jgi:hypothetical protein